MTCRNGPSIVRWGSGTRVDSMVARTRLLDAALICYQRLGIAPTSVGDIARQARVTRPTVYRHFDSHEDILKNVVRRELERFWKELWDDFEGETFDLSDFLVEMLTCSIYCAHTQLTNQFLFLPGVLPILQKILLDDIEHRQNLSALLRPLLSPQQDSAANAESNLLVFCEWFNRILASYLARPSTLCVSQSDLRRLFQFLVPPLNKAETSDRTGVFYSPGEKILISDSAKILT
jgi:AcrR family transcriptional regulator